MKNLLPILFLLQGSCLFGKIMITEPGWAGGESLRTALEAHTGHTLEIEIHSDIKVATPLPPIKNQTTVTITGVPDQNGKKPTIYSAEGAFHVDGAKSLRISQLTLWTSGDNVSVVAHNISSVYFSFIDAHKQCARLSDIYFLQVEDSTFSNLDQESFTPAIHGYAIHTSLFTRNTSYVLYMYYLHALKDPLFLPFLEQDSWLPSYPTTTPALFLIENIALSTLAFVSTCAFVPPGGWDPQQLPHKKFIKTALFDETKGGTPKVQTPFFYLLGNQSLSVANGQLTPIAPTEALVGVIQEPPSNGLLSTMPGFFGTTNNISTYFLQPKKDILLTGPQAFNNTPTAEGTMVIPELYPTALPVALIFPTDDAQTKIDDILRKGAAKEGIFLFFFPGEYTIKKPLSSSNIFIRGVGKEMPKLRIQRDNQDLIQSPAIFQANSLFLDNVYIEDLGADPFKHPLIESFSLVIQHSYIKTDQAVFAQYPSANIASLPAPPADKGWATLSVCAMDCLGGRTREQTVFKNYPEVLAFTSRVNMKPKESQYSTTFSCVEGGNTVTSLADTTLLASTLSQVIGKGTTTQAGRHTIDLQRGENVLVTTKAVLEISGDWQGDTQTNFTLISGTKGNDLFLQDGIVLDGTNIPTHINTDVAEFKKEIEKNTVHPLP